MVQGSAVICSCFWRSEAEVKVCPSPAAESLWKLRVPRCWLCFSACIEIQGPSRDLRSQRSRFRVDPSSGREEMEVA